MGKILEIFSEPFRSRLARSASLDLRIVLLVASCLLSLVSATVNGNHPHHCRCSEFIAELGYELDHCAILI